MEPLENPLPDLESQYGAVIKGRKIKGKCHPTERALLFNTLKKYGVVHKGVSWNASISFNAEGFTIKLTTKRGKAVHA